MELDKIKWVSITVLGLTLIVTSGILGYTYLQIDERESTEVQDNIDNKVDFISKQKALSAVKSTESYNRLVLSSSSNSNANLTAIKVDQELIETLNRESINSTKYSAYLNANVPYGVRTAPILLKDSRVNMRESWLVIVSVEDSAHVYQLDREGEVVTELPGSQASEAIDSLMKEYFSSPKTVIR